MKSVVSILLVAFVFGAVTLLAAQEPQTSAPPNATPTAASPTIVANSGVTTEASTTSGEQRLMTTPPQASESREQGRAGSKAALSSEPTPCDSESAMSESANCG